MTTNNDALIDRAKEIARHTFGSLYGDKYGSTMLALIARLEAAEAIVVAVSDEDPDLEGAPIYKAWRALRDAKEGT